ncbi:hypothetical protein [Arcanobacterium phocae]|uniref:hypothetical protein n=1 Tax=Arcanobacterium phocae TaxID=131112 RepID=UPI001C0EE4F5|nr:hypothetical protein [Arcanobacterium phocae]
MEVANISRPEAVVEQRFAEFLTGQGWQVLTKNPDYLDLLATRDGERLVAEIKGHTKYSGIDADVLFGQILRRMNDLSGATRYAIVIPEHSCQRSNEYPQMCERSSN